MTQLQRLDYLITTLMQEDLHYHTFSIPEKYLDKQELFRALVNVRPPRPYSETFIKIQDEYLQEELQVKGITTLESLKPIHSKLYLWQGDITTLKIDAIVNAANNQLLGCFIPSHLCIDNAIHTFAGIQLRYTCDQLMKAQGHTEPTGSAKITKAYNLPSKYILHTVGPIISDKLLPLHEDQLANCYQSCLNLASENNLHSLAFCCISTGEFRFPNQKAAEIAVSTVKEYQRLVNPDLEVMFNVFKELDHTIYKKLLSSNQ